MKVHISCIHTYYPCLLATNIEDCFKGTNSLDIMGICRKKNVVYFDLQNKHQWKLGSFLDWERERIDLSSKYSTPSLLAIQHNGTISHCLLTKRNEIFDNLWKHNQTKFCLCPRQHSWSWPGHLTNPLLAISFFVPIVNGIMLLTSL